MFDSGWEPEDLELDAPSAEFRRLQVQVASQNAQKASRAVQTASRALDKAIADAHDAGVPAAQMAALAGVSRETVYQALKRARRAGSSPWGGAS